jgi:hypothetical protein
VSKFGKPLATTRNQAHLLWNPREEKIPAS